MAKFKTWIHNLLFYIKHYTKTGVALTTHYIKGVWDQIKLKENTDIRVGVFILGYLLFSIVGAYNFAHLLAFGYIIWLLEKNLNKE